MVGERRRMVDLFMHLSIREVSKLLRVSERKVAEWIRRGVLRADRVNDQYLLHRSDLLEKTSSREIDVSAEIFVDSAAGTTPGPRLVAALRAGAIFYERPSDDNPTALRAIV